MSGDYIRKISRKNTISAAQKATSERTSNLGAQNARCFCVQRIGVYFFQATILVVAFYPIHP
jgi:hypothetical protein